jgi:hypothetical protein
MSKEEQIIKKWGSSELYFRELEEFLKKHSTADTRTVCSEGCLVGVTYYFRPYQVWQDDQLLMEAIREANEKAE